MILKADRKILLGLTTTPGSDWREKTREIDFLGLKEVALFPTFLSIKERRELYALLEGTGLREIPHVHLRDDMEEWEINYFLERWKTQLFNIHQTETLLKQEPIKKRIKQLFVENQEQITDDFKKTLKESAGLCVDFSHWKVRQDNRRKGYFEFENLFEKYPIGCCHISAVRKRWGLFWEDAHYMKKISELDYMEEFVQYLPKIVSLELENSFVQQLKAKEYLEKMIFSSSALEK